MSGFDPNEYFNRRSAEIAAGDRLISPNDKLAAVEQASIRARDALQQRSIELQGAIDASKDSWVSKLGVDPNGLTGKAVNLAASGIEGSANLATGMGAFAVSDLPSIFGDTSLSQDQKAAISRYYQGKATPYDKIMIGAPTPGEPAGNTTQRPEGVSAGYLTPLQTFEHAVANRQQGQNIRNAVSEVGASLVHKDAGDALSADLHEHFGSDWGQTQKGAVAAIDGDEESRLAGVGDALAGVAKMGYHAAAAALNNKTAVLNAAVENAPQLVLGAAGKVGAAGMALSNVAYGTDYYQKGMQAYQDQHNGALPDGAAQAEIAAWAASLAAAEHVGSVLELGAAHGAEHAVVEGGKTGLLQAAKNVAHAGLEGGLEEAMTEGYQGYAEGQASQEPATAESVYEQSVLGGLVGAHMSGGGRAVGEALKATPEHAEEAKTNVSRAAAQSAAVASGDISALVDPKAPTYDPAGAVAALHGNASLDTATPESKQANLVKANEIVAKLQEQKDNFQTDLEDSSPEQLQKLQTQLVAAQTAGDTAKATAIQSLVDEGSKVDRKATQGKLDKVSQRLDDANEYMGRFHAETATQDDVKVAVETLKAPIDSTDTAAMATQAQAADKLITLSMASPERLDTDTATALAEDSKNGLSDDQRGYLRKFTAARLAENAIKDASKTSQEIYAGSDKNVGIVQYRAQVTAALAAGNRAQADRLLGLLSKFEEDHAAKADMVAKAWDEFKTTGRGVQVVRNQATKTWEINRGPTLSRKVMTENGGVTVYDRTPADFVAQFAPEARAISAAHNELAAAYALKFSTAPKEEAHVPLVPQAHVEAPAQSAGKQAAPVVAAPAQDAAGSTGSRDPASTGERSGVEAPGVVAEVAKPAADSEQTAADTQSTAVGSVDLQAAPSAVTAETSGREDGQHQSKNSTTEVVDQATTSPESAEQTSEQSHETGKLSAFNETAAEDAPYHLRNLIADFFTQNESREGATTKRPLVAVKNFLDALINKTTTAAEFLSGVTLSEPQRAAVQSFLKQARAWQDSIQANLPSLKAPEFRHENMMQFLLTKDAAGKVDVDQNVKLAIAYAATTGLMDIASAPRYMEKKSINSLLGRSKKQYVSPAVSRSLAHVGKYQHLTIDALGGKVMDALGLKASTEAAKNLEPTLRAALGGAALKLLEDEGLITRTTISGYDMQALREFGLNDYQISKLKPMNVKLPHTFFAATRNEDGALHADVQKITEAQRNTQGILDKLFQVDSTAQLPSLEPITTVQATTAGTRQGVPKELQAIIRKKQERPNYVRVDTVELLGEFNDDDQHTMFGVEEIDEKTMHLANRRSQEAKNEGLRREWSLFQEYIGEYLATAKDGLKTPFYLPFSVWKQQRVGIASTAVNPQTSKIHRFLMGSKEWTTEIDPSNKDLMDSFWLRVAEGLKVKTERQDNQLSIDAVKVTLAGEVYTAAVAALVKKVVRKEALSAAEKASIVAGVAKGGANLHTLDALIGVARQQGAMVDGNQGPFTVQMMGEVDGVANGTMLNHVLLGAKGSKEELQQFAEQGGFYKTGSQYSQYNQYRGTLGNLDVYESTARKLYDMVGKLFDSKSDEQRAIWAVAGEIFIPDTGTVTSDGRNLVKDALNPLGFGSSVTNVVSGMSGVFMDNIYKGFEKLSKNKANQAVVDTYVDHVNKLIANPKDRVKLGQPIDWHMENILSMGAETQIRKVFEETVGVAVTAVIQDEFKPFLDRRDALNNTAQLTYTLYDVVKQGVRSAMIEELLAKGEIPVDKNGARIGDLNSEQEAELDARMQEALPVIGTAMSAKDKGNRTGMLMAKTKRSQNQDDTYQNHTQFGTPLKNGKKGIDSRGMTTNTDTPGVAMGSATTHSTDSAISHWTQAERVVLNIHDAVGDGVGGLQQSAHLMNQNTWKALLEYSPLTAAYEALRETVLGIDRMLDEDAEHPLPPQAIIALQQFLRENDLEAKMDKAYKVAYQANKTRLEFMVELSKIDQYAFQGGAYEVTEPNHDDAQARLDALEAEPSKDVRKEHAALNFVERLKPKTVKATPTGKTTNAEESEPVIDDLADTAETDDIPGNTDDVDRTTKTSPFGDLGEPTIPSDPSLVAFFEANPNPTARQVIEHLYRKLDGAPGRKNEFSAQLLRLLGKTVTPDMKVTYITPKTAEDSVQAKPSEAARGWFVPNGDKSQIYVLSPEFKDSGLTNEVLLHELTHGALAHLVANPTAEIKPLIAELDALRTKAAEYAKQQGITNFAAALSNVDEFISWGMTNQEFQRQVISQVSMPSTTGSTSLVNGMKKFIANLVGILFKGSAKNEQEQAVNGLTTLITNVSGLFNQAGTTTTSKQAPVSVLSMATNPVGVLQTFSTLDIHNALNAGAVTPEFGAQLRGVLGGIVQKLHGPFGGLKEFLKQEQALTPFDVWQKAIATGKAPFSSMTQVAPMVMSEQERHAMDQVEVTVQEALSHNEVSTKMAYRDLSRLYAEVHAVVKPTDFNSQAEYDFVFGLAPDAEGRSEHLARFAAFGLANQQFNKILQGITTATTRKVRDGKSFAERMQIIFEQILEFFHGDLPLAYGGKAASSKLADLVGKLVDVEAKRILTLSTASKIGMFDIAADKVATAARTAVNKAVGVPWVANSQNSFVKLAANFTKLAANQQVMKMLDVMNDIRDRNTDETHGVISGLLTEVRGVGKMLNGLQLMATNQQRQRQKLIKDLEKLLPTAFANAEALTKEASGAITKVFLRTGMHALAGNGRMNMTELENVLDNKHAAAMAIKTLEAQLPAGQFKDNWIHQANALAYYTATGESITQTLMMNAHNIARVYDLPGTRVSEAEATQAQAALEQLIPLYAIAYLKSKDVLEAKAVLHAENTRATGKNAIEFTLAYHRMMQEESRDKLFEGQEALMQHGYVSEILNPHTQTAVANAAMGKELRFQGYVKAGAVQVDPSDPNKEARDLYVLKDGGVSPIVTGSMLNTGLGTKGTTQHNGYMNVNTAEGLANAQLQQAITSHKMMNAALASGPRPDLSKGNHHTYMTPVLNPRGEIVNWRDMMNSDTRDLVLERNNSFESVLGALAGSIYDKQSTPVQNAKVVAALRDVYKAQHGTNPRSFLLVGPKSTDPELRDIWRMLPDSTRALIGKDGLHVRKDAINTVFGYRKYSLSEAFKKDAAQRDQANGIEKVFVWSMEHMLTTIGTIRAATLTKPEQAEAREEALNLAKRAAITIARGERIWQGIMKEAKDIIVVKSGVTMLANIKANTVMLQGMGVGAKDIATGYMVAMRGARDYQNHTEELAALQADLDTKLTNGRDAEIKRRIAVLTDAIARNPVKKIIDLGLMPTISEDQGQEDPYAYKNIFTKKTDELVALINPKVVRIAKNLYQAKDTAVYQGLSRITQLSDFAGRYVLYKHLTERADNPLSEEDATFAASETFVNYDIPMHKGMQYLDDMGFTMFIKYFLRMQRVIMRVSKDNPGRVMASVLLHHFAGSIPSVLESSWMAHFGNNPFSAGIFQAPGTLMDLGSVASVHRLLK